MTMRSDKTELFSLRIGVTRRRPNNTTPHVCEKVAPFGKVASFEGCQVRESYPYFLKECHFLTHTHRWTSSGSGALQRRAPVCVARNAGRK
jgi:hypothetical protein